VILTAANGTVTQQNGVSRDFGVRVLLSRSESLASAASDKVQPDKFQPELTADSYSSALKSV
jgi:hypothetical protein